VSHHSDGYSGLHGGATLLTAYRGTAIAEPRYAVDYYTDAIASDQGFQGSKKEGPGRFIVNFGDGLYVVWIWMTNRL